jgi:hypothetical protein
MAACFRPLHSRSDQVLANYALLSQRLQKAWMLGRFVLPVAHGDLVACRALAFLSNRRRRRPRPNPPSRRLHRNESIDPAQIESAVSRIPKNVTPYFEITDLTLLPVIRAAGARAKIRTGGITP